MRIRFLADQVYDTGAPNSGPRFPAGFVLDETGVGKALGLAEEPTAEYARSFLNRWVNRKAAEIVDERTPVSTEAVEKVTRKAKKGAPAALGTKKRGRDTAGLDDGKQVEKIDLNSLTRADLDDLAKKRGVDISDAKNKGDVIAALELAAE